MTKGNKRTAGKVVDNEKGREGATGIAEITVAGFKSLRDEQRIEVRPLTILAGPNSSGKSSLMQPLLLLKQTLESPYDPGAILLNGPAVKFTLADQLLSRTGRGPSLGSFQVGMGLNSGDGFVTSFTKEHKSGFRIERVEITSAGRTEAFWPEMTPAEITRTGVTKGMDLSPLAPPGYSQGRLRVVRDRCFLGPVWEAKGPDGTGFSHGLRPGARWEEIIPQVIYLPGLRGNPERTYPVTAVGPTYPGTFEKYTASIISRWADESSKTLKELSEGLKVLGLTGGVSAVRPNDVQIELYVGRLLDVPPERPEDRVNIADVGIGVSQTLPVLVALLAARPGQLVYVEQPETHLHPRAQFALAQVLASAVARGVRVVVETHSSILLLGVQTLVAEGQLEPDKVKLHWFRLEKGRTVARSGDLDDAGRFGDWPEDFDDTFLQADKRYLDAADARLAGK
jgi:hypothetical protein